MQIGIPPPSRGCRSGAGGAIRRYSIVGTMQRVNDRRAQLASLVLRVTVIGGLAAIGSSLVILVQTAAWHSLLMYRRCLLAVAVGFPITETASGARPPRGFLTTATNGSKRQEVSH